MTKYFYITVFFILVSCRDTNSQTNINKGYNNNLNSVSKKLNELGVTLDYQFVIGNADKILKASKKQDYDYFNKIETEGNLADFSLHIGLKDIEMLVHCASIIKNKKDIGFQDNFNLAKKYIDEPEYGAIQLTPNFITFFSSIDDSDVEEISKNWFTEMSKAYPAEEIKIADDAKQAIRKLIHISKQAKLNNNDMVFLWTS
jgi:hypothetical protein